MGYNAPVEFLLFICMNPKLALMNQEPQTPPENIALPSFEPSLNTYFLFENNIFADFTILRNVLWESNMMILILRIRWIPHYLKPNKMKQHVTPVDQEISYRDYFHLGG